jgi:beta-glucosidase
MFLCIERVKTLSSFSNDFKWGAATSSYQIEGAAHTDGRGPSIWDTFCATPGKVRNMENGDVACDHYHRYPEDVALMKELGIQTYRFSLAWPRMFPNGDTVREERGFDFYNRLINELLANDIEPVITIYHWDLPQPLQDKGGWANRDIVDVFAHYAAAAVEAFGDRVKNWITLNEPWCASWLGYASGVHAPGVKDIDQAIAAAHHSALAHGVATRAMRAVRSDIRVGIALNMTNYRVDDPNNAELNELAGLMDSHINRWWADAAVTGHYPANLVESYGERLEKLIMPGDHDLLKVKNDFLGINYYSDSFLGTPDEDTRPIIEGGLFPFPQRTKDTPPSPQTDMGWPITPEGLHDLVLRVARDWPELGEIIITENGAAYPEGPDADGEVHDQRRIDYLTSHLEALGRACEEGAPVSRYYAWSLMDNFEWAEGYAKRFGLIHVDFETLVRTPKQSARVYATIIQTNGESLKAVSV